MSLHKETMKPSGPWW